MIGRSRVGDGLGSSMGWVGLRRVRSIFCSSDGSGRVGSIVQKGTMDFLLLVNSCQYGSGRVGGYNFWMGWVGLLSLWVGSGWVKEFGPMSNYA